MSAPYQVMEPMTPDEFEALKADIALHGVLVPVEIDELGNILDGHHRVRACEELGLTDYPMLVRSGIGDDAAKRTHARSLNFIRRQVTPSQRRRGIADQLRDTPEKSDREVARIIGCSHRTVSAVRSELVATGQIAQLDYSVGRDGRTRATNREDVTDPIAMMRRHGEIECAELPEGVHFYLEHPEGSDFFYESAFSMSGHSQSIGHMEPRGIYIDREWTGEGIYRSLLDYLEWACPEVFFGVDDSEDRLRWLCSLSWKPTGGGRREAHARVHYGPGVEVAA